MNNITISYEKLTLSLLIDSVMEIMEKSNDAVIVICSHSALKIIEELTLHSYSRELNHTLKELNKLTIANQDINVLKCESLVDACIICEVKTLFDFKHE